VISSTNLFVGAHLPQGSMTKCRQISMNSEHLDDWAMQSGGFVKYEGWENSDGGSIQHIALNVPNEITFDAFGASALRAVGPGHGVT